MSVGKERIEFQSDMPNLDKFRVSGSNIFLEFDRDVDEESRDAGEIHRMIDAEILKLMEVGTDEKRLKSFSCP